MDPIQALLLGIVEGVTEYLPVSSTGHLILAQRLMGLGEGEANNAYAILVQFGAILAVVGLFRHRVLSVLNGLVGRDSNGLRLGINLAVAFLPAAVVGILAGSFIKHALFSLWVVAAAWIVGGVVLVILSRRRVGVAADAGFSIDSLTAKHALLIGLFQVIAMWPGVSRSLATILGGLSVGLSLVAAVEFSFLLGVVTLTAATAKEAVSSGQLVLSGLGEASVAIGLVAALVSAALAVRWMIGYLSRHSLEVFGWYRIALALITVALLASGILPAT